MTRHDHRAVVPGCYRCELSADEVPTWRLGTNDDNSVDEVVMWGAYVHLEDLGNAYMLIVENSDRHIHLTIPSRKKRKAFVYEEHVPDA